MEADTQIADVLIYFDSNRLVITYGNDRAAVMDLDTDEDIEIIKMLINSPDLWASFLGSLSAALTQHK